MTKPSRSYKEIRDELNVLIDKLQDDNTDIDSVIELYQKGQSLVKELESYIKNAENKIKQIKPKKSN